MKQVLIIGLFALLLGACNQATKNNNPVVVLTFDDAEISHLTTAAPILKKYGFDATFFVCDFTHRNKEDELRYMTWSQIKELHDMGFEIGNHTGHHKNVTKLTREELIAEVRYIEEKCTENGIPQPVTFAYPGNRNDSISQAIIAELGYKFARAGSSKLYKPEVDKIMAVPSYTTLDASERIVKRVNKAIHNLKKREIIVLTFHGVSSTVNPAYSTSVEYFEELLKYMKDNKLNVIAMRNLDRYIQ